MLLSASGALLPPETLPDRFGVLLHRLVGKADEDRKGDDQQQAHHQARAADPKPVAARLDGAQVCRIGFVFVFHPLTLPARLDQRERQGATRDVRVRRNPAVINGDKPIGVITRCLISRPLAQDGRRK